MDRRSFIGTGAIAAAGVFLDGGFARALAQASKGAPGATVATTAGKGRGLLIEGVHAFKGVRYGASTAGARRFLPPGKPQPGAGIPAAFGPGLRVPPVGSGAV